MTDEAAPRSAWNEAVAAQLRAERAASGKTQREVMAQSGIPKSTYLRLESGERKADADQLAALMAVFGLRLSTFFQRVEDRVRSAPRDPSEADLLEGLPAHVRRELEGYRRKAKESGGTDERPMPGSHSA